MHVLAKLAPFVLGVIIQISAIIGGAIAAPTDTHTVEANIQRDQFAYALDMAVYPPAFLTLAGAVLLEWDDVSGATLSIIVVLALCAFLAGFAWLRARGASSYMVTSNKLFGITLLNASVILLNLVCGAGVLIAAS